MPGGRHRARELALKVLFQLENRPADDPEEALAYHADDAGSQRATVDFARRLVQGVLDHRATLDAAIAAASEHWRIEQMGKVDRVVLRMAIYEIDHEPDVPVRAAINESIELAKTFGGEESGRFVNGVLGKVAEGRR